MAKKKTTIPETATNETDREIIARTREALVKDLMWWISDKDFEPPFPYNVLYPKRDERNYKYCISVLKEAVDRVYVNTINEME